jgi:hypothetical protein
MMSCVFVGLALSGSLMKQPTDDQWARFRSGDPYAVLGLPALPRPADPAAVKKAHASLAKVWHPDKGGHTEVMQLINNAVDFFSAGTPHPAATPPPAGSGSDTSAPPPPPAGSASDTSPPPSPPLTPCGDGHTMVKRGVGAAGRMKYAMFSAAADGCLKCVRYYVEVKGVDAASWSDTGKWNSVEWAEWARGEDREERHEKVATYLRTKIQ